MIPFKPPEDRLSRHGVATASGTDDNSEAHSRILIEQVAQAIFETEPSGKVSNVTRSWLAYTGQSLEEALGFGWIDALHPDDRAAIARLRAEGTAARRDINGEFRVRRADGSWAWNNVRATPVFGPDGEIRKWTGMTIDISAQRDAEARLAESLEDYRYSVELNPQMPWTATPGGRIISLNEHWCRFIGRSREEALAAPLDSYCHPDDVEQVRTEFLRCIATGDPYDTRFRVLTPDRGTRWIRSRMNPRREGGRIVRWYGFNEDIHDAVLAETELRAAEQRYRLVAQAASDVIWDMDIAADIVTWGNSLGSRFGHQIQGARVGRDWWVARIHPDDRERIVAQADAVRESGDSSWTSQYRFERADGSYAHVLNRGHLIRDAEGRPIRAIGALLDLTDKLAAEAAMRLSEERFRLAVTVSRLGVSDYDVRTNTLHWSDELRAIIGVDADEPASQQTGHALIHPDDRAGAEDFERRARRGDFSHRYRALRRIFRRNDGAMRWVSTEGRPIYDADGRLVRVILTVQDVTEEKTARDRLHWIATHDAVTGLANRAAFQTALDFAIEGAVKRREPLALLLIDLDNFKEINDSFGHHAGDLVLRTFADRIGEILPKGAVLARFGGDEFAVVLPETTPEAAPLVAADLIAILRRPFALGGRTLDLRASVGVAVLPEEGASAEDLVKNADMALYAAKDVGRATVRVFEPAMRSTMQEHASMLSQARAIVDNEWAQPFYQPKIAFASGRVMGLEALFRWRHPSTGLHSPASIAPAFDDFELAAGLGETMVEAVLADVRRWLDQRIDTGRVAINASAAEFRHPDYAGRLLARLAAHGVPPTAIELEITETAFLVDSDDRVLHALETLRAAGMTIALDDFGTGFSSLSHLRRFPVDTLKIDQSFVGGIDAASGDRAIVDAVLRLGEALGLTTVAEGVETESQAEFLRSRGCRLAQGYLFARPLPAGEIAAFIAARGAERRAG